mgnify:CR=1 FL=1
MVLSHTAENELDWLKVSAPHSLLSFTEYLGYVNAKHHEDLYKTLEDETKKRIIVIWPPGHGKSTCATVNYPLWRIGKNHELRFIIASHRKDFVKSFPREIRAHMLSPAYIELFGNLKPHHPDVWTQDQLVVTRDRILKDPTITALGVGQGLIGIRADEIICDDVQDETRARSEVIRASDRAWFKKELLGRLEPDGRLIYICNRYHQVDLAGELLEEAERDRDLWTVLGQPAIDKDNNALWPDRWSLNYLLARKREVGSPIFQCVWQGDPTALIGMIFKAEWLEYYQVKPALDTLRIVMGVDLAISEKQTADFFAIVVLGMDKDGIIYLLDYYQGRLDFPAQLKMVEAYAAAYHPTRIGVEQTAYQKAFVQAIRPTALPVIGVDAKGDKQERIQQLAPFIENKTFRLSKQQDDFIMQLLQFPTGEHDDLLDACEIARRQLAQIWIQPRVDFGKVNM